MFSAAVEFPISPVWVSTRVERTLARAMKGEGVKRKGAEWKGEAKVYWANDGLQAIGEEDDWPATRGRHTRTLPAVVLKTAQFSFTQSSFI